MQISYIFFTVFYLVEFISEITGLLANVLEIDFIELESSDGLCLSIQRKQEEFERLRQTIDSALSDAIAQENYCTTDMPYSDPESDTTTQQPTVQSSYCCNGTPGWRRVAFLNMTDYNYSCPAEFNLTSYSKRACGLPDSTQGGCASTIYTVGGLEYSQVCGMLRGYQFGVTSAFAGYSSNGRGLNNQYLDGISLTYGAAGSRQHIWSFVAGATEYPGTMFPQNACPCDTSNYAVVPPFVGKDYFCESAETSPWTIPYIYTFYPDDPLWDGQNCLNTSSCCQLNNPPWFTKVLSNTTSDDLELRMCADSGRHLDNIALEFIELYVK